VRRRAGPRRPAAPHDFCVNDFSPSRGVRVLALFSDTNASLQLIWLMPASGAPPPVIVGPSKCDLAIRPRENRLASWSGRRDARVIEAGEMLRFALQTSRGEIGEALQFLIKYLARGLAPGPLSEIAYQAMMFSRIKMSLSVELECQFQVRDAVEFGVL
jgi:hypothetical protein